jgi:hypothetical protein
VSGQIARAVNAPAPAQARAPRAYALGVTLRVAVSLAAALLVAAAFAAAAAPARGATSATIATSLSPDRLGARASLTFTIHYADVDAAVPSPVRRSVLRLPAGMSLYVPSLRSCTAARLRASGVGGCPARSQLGAGHALVETQEGSQIIAENVALHAFLGPPDNLLPTFEILAQGYTPLDKRTVFGGSVRSASPPYGEELAMSTPPVPTLPLEPDASIVTFSLTVGASGRPRDHSSVLVPSSCPAGGFPFAAEFAYADGSTGSAVASIPCPPPLRSRERRMPVPAARAARTIALSETGRLRLTSKHNFTLNEQGSASGTAAGTIYVHLTAVSSSRVTAEVNIYPRGGSISGYGTASYRRSGSTASFSGSMSIARGTGSYAHIHGSGLSFSGTIQEADDDAITVHVSGRASD